MTGAAGSVQSSALVAVSCLDTAHVQIVQADEQGAFHASLSAPEGASLLVTDDYSLVSTGHSIDLETSRLRASAWRDRFKDVDR